MTTSAQIAELVDSKGRTLAAVRSRLSADRYLWPPANRIERGDLNGKQHSDLFGGLHDRPDWQFCWGCGRRAPEVVIQIHHIGQNRNTRSDEISCVLPLCWMWADGNGCHANIEGNLAKVLGCKWRWGREDLSWERVTLCQRYFLPEPEFPPHGEEFWLPGFKIKEPTR